MSLHRIKKGFGLPIAGEPEQTIYLGPQPKHVALLTADYLGLHPDLAIAPGDVVKRGQILFADAAKPGVCHTAPGAGRVVAINRDERGALQSVVIELNENEYRGRPSPGDMMPFESFTGNEPAGLSRDEIKALLLESGMWTALRTRPFGKTPNPETVPEAVFVTAMDTNPLAPSPAVVLRGNESDFERGLLCVAKLTEGKTYVCKSPDAHVPVNPNTGIYVEEFEGPHPAGTVGVHIHFLEPVGRDKTVWHLNYQEVIAIGRLFRTGNLDVDRVVSLAGPVAKKPRLLKTRIGTSLDELTTNEFEPGDNRLISGSVLSGRAARGKVLGYLGRHHQQISVLREDHERHPFEWMTPGTNRYSATPVFLSSLFKGRRFALTTNMNGRPHTSAPLGIYERVMPMDILPTFLFRALAAGNTERAEQLGCLELDEEDLALCTFVCPSKHDYTPLLRRNLDIIEKEIR